LLCCDAMEEVREVSPTFLHRCSLPLGVFRRRRLTLAVSRCGGAPAEPQSAPVRCSAPPWDEFLGPPRLPPGHPGAGALGSGATSMGWLSGVFSVWGVLRLRGSLSWAFPCLGGLLSGRFVVLRVLCLGPSRLCGGRCPFLSWGFSSRPQGRTFVLYGCLPSRTAPYHAIAAIVHIAPRLAY
jgi:hypothetical protein